MERRKDERTGGNHGMKDERMEGWKGRRKGGVRKEGVLSGHEGRKEGILSR